MLCSALILTALLYHPQEAAGNGCSREISRQIRGYLAKEVFPALRLKPDELSISCPLNPLLDVYMEHEKHKAEHKGSDWQCQYCNKRFVNEYYLDRHLQNQHMDLIPAQATVCLADYCSMFGCKPTSEQQKRSMASQKRFSDPDDTFLSKSGKTFGTLDRCSSNEVASIRQDCYAVSERCFADDEKYGSTMEERFNQVVCSNVRCVNGILKGGINVEEESDGVVFKIFRILILAVIVSILLIQVLFTDSIYYNLMSMFGARSKNDNYVAQFQTRNSRGYGWFVDTVLDAFKWGASKKKNG
mmetsp:Transcript_21040/g.35294  ORF Transcript_21040/g.35294 Transcript_21040/m.35294 type:complete len:300 (+) Transcript_21040:49-948(+)